MALHAQEYKQFDFVAKSLMAGGESLIIIFYHNNHLCFYIDK